MAIFSVRDEIRTLDLLGLRTRLTLGPIGPPLELKHLQYGTIFTTCLNDKDTEGNDNKVWEKGLHKYSIELPMDLLREGEYIISAAATIPKVEVLDVFNYDTLFSILDSTSPVAKTTEGRNGAILPVIEWKKTDSVLI